MEADIAKGTPFPIGKDVPYDLTPFLKRTSRVRRTFSPVAGVDGDVAEDLSLAGDADFAGDAQAVAQDLLSRINLRKIFSAGDDGDPAACANAVAVAGTGNGKAGLQKRLHKIGTAFDGDLGQVFGEANLRHPFILRQESRLGKLLPMDRAVILGASRGLGAELVRAACAATYPVVGFGRKEEPLRQLREAFPLFEYTAADFSSAVGQKTVIQQIQDLSFSKLFYVAGGGPYGAFGSKNWDAHEWAWEVTFRFPAKLLHFLAQGHRFEQVILVGSSVAEDQGDKSAASYASAKHALKGLWSSLRLDYPEWDLRLFSPGYMDTALLPKTAAVRQRGVYSPRQVAEQLWTWSLTADYGGHTLLPKHPL